jgi:glutamate/tyrosine decarboxylase-like PLP-dependent enzyme
MQPPITLDPSLAFGVARTFETLGAWFLGPRGENYDLLARLAGVAMESHARARAEAEPIDPPWITPDIKASKQYIAAVKQLEELFLKLLDDLKQSVPFYSYRYQAHMLWDVTLPGMLGYLAALPWNQNNVAAEASPVTTMLEMKVGDDLCRMLGYTPAERNPLPSDPDEGTDSDETDEEHLGAWGHITSGGTVANIESMWAARNLKYYAAALAAALRDDASPLSHARGLRVRLPDSHQGVLAELDTWRLLNLKADDVLALAGQLRKQYGVSPATLAEALQAHSIQGLGAAEFHRRYLGGFPAPVVVGPATMHYSWRKGAAILGVGAENVLRVHVALNCRLDVVHLRQTLDRCLAERRPVLQVVAVLGTTEHSAVDPLADMLALREEYRRAGLEFAVHVDAAWGGYFASMLRQPPKQSAEWDALNENFYITGPEGTTSRTYPAEKVMSRYVRQQFAALPQADSVTVDPHKAGFIPYPAGALCYRDVRMRELVSLRAPVVFHGDTDLSVGVYGIEGSKPGAAVAAVYLSHLVIRPDARGYGMILGKTMFNATRFYSAVATMDIEERKKVDKNEAFLAAPLQQLPSQRRGRRPSRIADERSRVEKIVPISNDDLIERLQRDAKLERLFAELGPDENIVPYAFNFYVRETDHMGRARWVPNQSIRLLNLLNDEIFKALSIFPPENPNGLPLIVTASALDPQALGEHIVRDFLRRLEVTVREDYKLITPISFLITTVANPWLTDTAPPGTPPDAHLHDPETTPGEASAPRAAQAEAPAAGRHNMIPTLIEALKTEVRKQIGQIRRDLDEGAEPGPSAAHHHDEGHHH